MHKFLEDEWFAALDQSAVLHDPSEAELKTCVFNFEITDAQPEIESTFHLVSVGQEMTLERGGHGSPHIEARLGYDKARDLMLAPSVDAFRAGLVHGEILARGDLIRSFDLLERLATDPRGEKLIAHLRSITA